MAKPVVAIDRNIDIEATFNDTMIWVSKMIPQYSVKDLYEVPDIITVMGLINRAEVIQEQKMRKEQHTASP